MSHHGTETQYLAGLTDENEWHGRQRKSKVFLAENAKVIVIGVIGVIGAIGE